MAWDSERQGLPQRSPGKNEQHTSRRNNFIKATITGRRETRGPAVGATASMPEERLMIGLGRPFTMEVG